LDLVEKYGIVTGEEVIEKIPEEDVPPTRLPRQLEKK